MLSMCSTDLGPDFFIEITGDVFILLGRFNSGLTYYKRFVFTPKVNCSLKCRESYYRVDRRKISFLRFIVEAYGGIGVISTIEPRSGVIVVKTAPGCESEMDDLIDALSRQIRIEPL